MKEELEGVEETTPEELVAGMESDD